MFPDSIDFDINTITLYGVRDRKIQAIKAIRALGPVMGGSIGLKVAKDAVDNIERHPIKVTVRADYVGIVRMALEAYFVTREPQADPVNVSSLVTYPDPDPMLTCIPLDYPLECDGDGIPF